MADEDSTAPKAKTVRDYAREYELADWELAQLCAVTKRGPDEAADDEMIAAASEFLSNMKLGG